jgi:hypothetical protein
MCVSVHFWAMLSPGDRAIIKAEIKRLQKAQRECRDDGIRRQIDDWIVEQKQKLALDTNPSCHICGKPCPPEGSVTDAQGRAVHKECFRTALIEGRSSL